MKEKIRDNEIKKKDVAEADKKAITNTNLIAKTDMNMIHLENRHLAMRDRIQETAEVPYLQEETKTENEDTRGQRIERENTQDLPTEKESIQDPTLLTEFLKREDMPKEHNQHIIRIEMIITKEIQTHMWEIQGQMKIIDKDNGRRGSKLQLATGRIQLFHVDLIQKVKKSIDKLSMSPTETFVSAAKSSWVQNLMKATMSQQVVKSNKNIDFVLI